MYSRNSVESKGFLQISRILPTSEDPTTAKESIKLLRTCKGNFKTNFSQPRAAGRCPGFVCYRLFPV